MTTNTAIRAKVKLRADTIKIAFNRPVSVFDAYAAKGCIWKMMRSRVDVESYWGTDYLKTNEAGTATIDVDNHLVIQHTVENDVIDMDAFGDPFSLYLRFLEYATKDKYVIFLTHGGEIAAFSERTLVPLGLSELDAPKHLFTKFMFFLQDICITKCYSFGYRVDYCRKMTVGRMSYIGLILEKI